MLARMKSLVLTSDRLFKKIAEEAERVFPAEKITWNIFQKVIVEAEAGKLKTALVLATKAPTSAKRKQATQFLFIERIEGSRVRARILFPLWGPASQQDKILQILLARLKCDFLVQSGGIVIEFALPFVPMEVKYGDNGNSPNGHGQKAFICPDEVCLS